MTLQNLNGKIFEKHTSIKDTLIKNLNFSLGKNYLFRDYGHKKVFYSDKKNFIKLLDTENLSDKKLYKQPDEAFLILYPDNTCSVKIIEKKNQTVNGSIFEKFYSCVYVRDICYKQHILNCKNIEYAYCVNNWLFDKICSDKQECIDLKKYLYDNKIELFAGNDKNYFSDIIFWLNV